jgi:hypothetical protein
MREEPAERDGGVARHEGQYVLHRREQREDCVDGGGWLL